MNAQIDALLATGVMRRLLAMTELKFSNSMIERIGLVPGQNPPRKVVNHGMQVGAGAVEQPDDG